MAKNPTEFETAFDIYKVTDVLGEGGSGRVFAAVDSAGSPHAVKCLRPDVATSDKRKRFRNELNFCSRATHPHLVRVVGSGIVNWNGKNAPFYVMPVYGGTLRQVMTRGVVPGIVLRIFDEILSGVEAAHAVGVVHRDLKPENVLCDAKGASCVVADFGIAHFEEDQILTIVETRQADKLLNIAYSAPEQRRRGAIVDHRADIYALGLILNEMFTGQVPEGAGHRAIADVAPEYAYLDALVEKMRQQEPGGRPRSDVIKRELLARGNDFVLMQRLDEKRKEVVPAFDPGAVEPVTLINAEWQDRKMVLTLSRRPEDEWMQAFHNPRGNYSNVTGMGPTDYRLLGSQMTVQVGDERHAQTAIDQFKQWSPMATRATQTLVDERAREQQARGMKQLAMDIEAMERARRVNSTLKF